MPEGTYSLYIWIISEFLVNWHWGVIFTYILTVIIVKKKYIHKYNTSNNVTHILIGIQFQWNIVSVVLSRDFGIPSTKNFTIIWFSNLWLLAFLLNVIPETRGAEYISCQCFIKGEMEVYILKCYGLFMVKI